MDDLKSKTTKQNESAHKCISIQTRSTNVYVLLGQFTCRMTSSLRVSCGALCSVLQDLLKADTRFSYQLGTSTPGFIYPGLTHLRTILGQGLVVLWELWIPSTLARVAAKGRVCPSDILVVMNQHTLTKSWSSSVYSSMGRLIPAGAYLRIHQEQRSRKLRKPNERT